MINLVFLGFPNYSVTEDGKVFAHHLNRFLVVSKSKQHHDKYAKVTIRNKERSRFICVHRLVAFAYLPKNPEKKYVNHIDGNIYNNHVSNLEWVTALENNLHSIEQVRKPQFIDNPDLKLPPRGDYKDRSKGRHTITEEEAIQYCEYMMQGYRGCDLRVMMGISGEIFTKFKNKREWKYKYIADRYDFSHIKSAKPLLTDEQVKQVCEMLVAGETIMNTYKTLGLERGVVRGIHGRRSYKHISKDYVW